MPLIDPATGEAYVQNFEVIDRQRAEIERLRSQLNLATCWNNTLIKMAGLEGSWVNGGVSVRQVADAIREKKD